MFLTTLLLFSMSSVTSVADTPGIAVDENAGNAVGGLFLVELFDGVVGPLCGELVRRVIGTPVGVGLVGASVRLLGIDQQDGAGGPVLGVSDGDLEAAGFGLDEGEQAGAPVGGAVEGVLDEGAVVDPPGQGFEVGVRGVGGGEVRRLRVGRRRPRHQGQGRMARRATGRA